MRWLSLAACAAVCLGCGNSADEVCGPDTVSESRTIDPGTFLEAHLEMLDAAQVTVDFSSDVALTYDLHIHDGQNVVNLVEGVAPSGSYDFTAQAEGPHFPLFFNATDNPAAVTVDLTLSDGTCWLSWVSGRP